MYLASHPKRYAKMITFLLGSSNPQGNTQKFAEICCKASGGKLINISDYQFSPWDYSGNNMDDDFVQLADLLIQSSQIVFCTPVYWYSMSSQMKMFFDRFSDLITRRKQIGRSLSKKRTWLLAVGSEPTLPEGFEVPFSRTSDYFDMQYMGSVYGCSADDKFSQSDIIQAKAFGTKMQNKPLRPSDK